MTQRPRRQRKGDRLVTPDASAEETRCDMAVAPLDRLAREMDSRWGVDRLPELVSPETAERYGSAIAKLNAAIAASNPADCVVRAQVCMRGLKAMNDEATAAGHEPYACNWMECEVDGIKFAIVRDPGDWPLVKKQRPDLQIYSMREIGLIVKSVAETPFVTATKQAFPGAQIAKIKPTSLPADFWENGGDEIPL